MLEAILSRIWFAFMLIVFSAPIGVIYWDMRLEERSESNLRLEPLAALHPTDLEPEAGVATLAESSGH